MLLFIVLVSLSWHGSLGDSDDQNDHLIFTLQTADQTTCTKMAIPGYPANYIETGGLDWAMYQCPENSKFDQLACGCVLEVFNYIPYLPTTLSIPDTTELSTTSKTTTTTTRQSTTTRKPTTTTTRPTTTSSTTTRRTTTASITTTSTTTTPISPSVSCLKRQNLNDPTKYEEHIAGHGYITRRCPAGTIFSPKSCECETDTRPKKKTGLCDGCRFDRGVGYNEHPNKCDKYIMCYPDARNQSHIIGIIRQCDVGEYWDQELVTCIRSEDAYCEHDPCAHNPGLVTYSYDGNCRGYWSCKYGVSIGHCCPSGQAFRETVGCVPDQTCTNPCKQTATTTTGKCDKTREYSNPAKFKQFIKGHGYVTMRCADGTIFNETLCECQTDNRPQQIQACRKEVDMDFKTSVTSTLHNRVHVAAVNVTHENGNACFHGNSALIIPRFSNADIGKHLEIQIKYKLERVADWSRRDKLQALIYNGDCGPDSSISVTVTPRRTVFGLANSHNESTSVELKSFKENYNWNHALFTLRNNLMTIQQNGHMVQRQFHGSIAKSVCGLKIGWGKGFESFQGCIKQLSISLCRS